MINYSQFEKEVYNWLLEKHKKNKGFNFSTRRKASKGSERDYFIGTAKSRYFGTTLWNIPVGFPGSANDLIDIIFVLNKNKFQCFIQFLQTKKPYDTQNTLALKFIQELKPVLKKNDIILAENNPDNKMEYYNIDVIHSIDDISILFSALDKSLSKIIPIVDEFLVNFKKQNPDFNAQRIDDDAFENLYQKKLLERLNKYQEGAIETTSPQSTTKSAVSLASSFDKLNMILYGPPGTGKTYNTINKAVEIIAPAEYERLRNNRVDLKDFFDDMLIENWTNPDGQIAFTTFHQSMSYEDFIEGIKPLEPIPGQSMQYDIIDGIFKNISNIAKSNYENSKTANVGKMNFEDAFAKLKYEIEENPELKFPLKTAGYDFTIIGFTKTSIQFKKSSGGTSHTLSIQTLKELYYGKEYDFKSGVGIYYPSVIARLESYGNENSNAELKNYVLIIDEINRGNVSQIFGELITVIEESKRIDNGETIEVILPYSKEKFSVPPNLYIIGTMNTADRSVEALDTALRRRFIFEEMQPKPELLSPERMIWKLWWDNQEYSWDAPKFLTIETALYDLLGFPPEKNNEDYKEPLWNKMDEEGMNEKQIADLRVIKFKDGINLQILLEKLNERIEALLSKDHLIGHSYFMNIKSIDDLKTSFYKNIIPLLQEYFYGDNGKIGLVLGEGFVKIKTVKKEVLAKFDYSSNSFDEKDIFILIDYRNSNTEHSVKINSVETTLDFTKAIKLMINNSID